MEQLKSILRSETRLPGLIQRDLAEWVDSSNSVRLFVAGKTGTGKSSLVNALIGSELAKVGGGPKPVTMDVEYLKLEISGVTIEIWDTPGLQDGKNKDKEYLTAMKACEDFHLALYCINVSVPRFHEDRRDITAMKLLTQQFGEKMWENALFVLTFANEIEDVQLKGVSRKKLPSEFTKKIQDFQTMLQDSLIRDANVDRNIAQKVSAVPVGHPNRAALPDCGHWLSAFWFASFYRVKPEAQPAMIALNMERIRRAPSEVGEQDASKFAHEQPIIFSEEGSQIAEKYGDKGIGCAIGLGVGVKVRQELELLLNSAANAKKIEIEGEEQGAGCVVL